MSVLYQRGPATVRGNLTPMIDMTFLLIVFFVLVSRIVDAEIYDRIVLPDPKDSLTQPIAEESRVIINIVPAPGGGVAGYRVAGRDFPADEAGRRAVSDLLREGYSRNPALNVNLRADRMTHFSHVEPMLEVIAAAAGDAAKATGSPVPGAARVNLVVIKEP